MHRYIFVLLLFFSFSSIHALADSARLSARFQIVSPAVIEQPTSLDFGSMLYRAGHNCRLDPKSQRLNGDACKANEGAAAVITIGGSKDMAIAVNVDSELATGLSFSPDVYNGIDNQTDFIVASEHFQVKVGGTINLLDESFNLKPTEGSINAPADGSFSNSVSPYSQALAYGVEIVYP